jgi:hypothetical protein
VEFITAAGQPGMSAQKRRRLLASEGVPRINSADMPLIPRFKHDALFEKLCKSINFVRSYLKTGLRTFQTEMVEVFRALMAAQEAESLDEVSVYLEMMSTLLTDSICKLNVRIRDELFVAAGTPELSSKRRDTRRERGFFEGLDYEAIDTAKDINENILSQSTSQPRRERDRDGGSYRSSSSHRPRGKGAGKGGRFAGGKGKPSSGYSHRRRSSPVRRRSRSSSP